MQLTPHPQASYMLITAAVSTAKHLGIHSFLKNSTSSETDIRQRRNVFWIIYILDHGASLRSGCPPSFHDDDIGVPLPDEEPHSGSQGLFRAMAELALIESRVYSKLYSARGRTRSESERLVDVARADKDIQLWKDKVPEQIRPGRVMACDEKFFGSVLTLHFSYYDCLETVHRASPYHQSWFSVKDPSKPIPPPNSPVNPRVYSSTEICINAARNIVNLIKFFVQRTHRRESLDWYELPPQSYVLSTLCCKN